MARWQREGSRRGGRGWRGETTRPSCCGDGGSGMGIEAEPHKFVWMLGFDCGEIFWVVMRLGSAEPNILIRSISIRIYGNSYLFITLQFFILYNLMYLPF